MPGYWIRSVGQIIRDGVEVAVAVTTFAISGEQTSSLTALITGSGAVRIVTTRLLSLA